MSENLHTPTLDREFLLEEHPVVTHRYTVITPMITKAYSIIRERVFARHTGTFMYARPRMGKTRCATITRDLLAAEFPRKYILYYTSDGDKSGRLMGDLVKDLKLPTRSKEPYNQLKEKFLLHVIAELEERNGNHFVLILDENQMLTVDAYAELSVIHNKLEDRGINMTTLGFGQSEILERQSLLFSLGATNLVARFLCEPIKFVGCLSLDDFTSILNEYDSRKEYPLDSGCTYTQFFLPQAYAAGFRLAKAGGLIWTALINIAGNAGAVALPLEHTLRVVEDILMRSRHMDNAEFSLSNEMVAIAIDKSLIQDFVMIMRQAPKKV
ncbi:ATP-binding protein [Pseudomonas kurunegalensis]|uniref:ATP-binding protein n=1 Tax=Pseudomonas kurunegalensis TaxID=485880 RepID=A0ACC5UQS3_9PSED|nr:ATP-binding protein [Pseudomonas kurunegalensis]MBV4516589.1 ATP-binding protein [Pseudomonas kurunegalensis]